jgi:hypothetical protein
MKKFLLGWLKPHLVFRFCTCGFVQFMLGNVCTIYKYVPSLPGHLKLHWSTVPIGVLDLCEYPGLGVRGLFDVSLYSTVRNVRSAGLFSTSSASPTFHAKIFGRSHETSGCVIHSKSLLSHLIRLSIKAVNPYSRLDCKKGGGYPTELTWSISAPQRVGHLLLSCCAKNVDK